MAAGVGLTLASCGDDQQEGNNQSQGEEQEPSWPTRMDPKQVNVAAKMEERAVAVAAGDCGVWAQDLEQAMKSLAKDAGFDWKQVSVGEPTTGKTYGTATTCDYPISGFSTPGFEDHSDGTVEKVSIAMLPGDSNPIGTPAAPAKRSTLAGPSISKIGESAAEKIREQGWTQKKPGEVDSLDTYYVSNPFGGLTLLQGDSRQSAIDLLTVSDDGSDQLDNGAAAGAWVSAEGKIEGTVDIDHENLLRGVALRINRAMVIPIEYESNSTW